MHGASRPGAKRLFPAGVETGAYPPRRSRAAKHIHRRSLPKVVAIVVALCLSGIPITMRGANPPYKKSFPAYLSLTQKYGILGTF